MPLETVVKMSTVATEKLLSNYFIVGMNTWKTFKVQVLVYCINNNFNDEKDDDVVKTP